MNRAIELHDSIIEFIFPHGDQTTIELNPAYLHESTGRPGVDLGAGFLQKVHLQFRGAEIASLVTDLPVRITDGWILTGEKRFENFVPLPLIHVGHTEIEIQTEKGEILGLRASGIVLILSGEKKQIEQFNSPTTT